MPVRKRKPTAKKRRPARSSKPKRQPPKRTPRKKKKSTLPKGTRAKMKKQLLKRLQEDQERRDAGGKGIFKPDLGLNFYSPEGGDHLIDIIPFLAGPNHPTVEEGDTAIHLRVKVHYGVGPDEEKSFICLKETFGQSHDCPICEHRNQLRTEGADEEIWKALFPKKRAIYNIVSYDTAREEDKGVQIWEVAEFYMQKHIDTLVKGSRRPGREVSDENLVTFTDPDDGKSIAFTINPPRTRNDFAEYIGHRFEDRDYIISDEILEETQALDQLIHIPTYDEVYEEYYGESVSEGDEEDEEEYDEEYDEDEEEEDEYEDEDEEEDEDDEDEEEEEEDECPGGGVFGQDTNELEGCDECEVWDECLTAQQTRRKAERKKKAGKKRSPSKAQKRRKLRGRR